MRRSDKQVLLGVLAWLLTAACALGQGASITGQVISTYGTPAAHAPIRVCLSASMGIPCTPTVKIYSDPALTQPMANPTTADQYGNYNFFVPTGAVYVVQVSILPGNTTYSYLYSFPSFPNGGGGTAGNSTSLILVDSATANRYVVHISDAHLALTNIGSAGTPSPVNGLFAGSSHYAIVVTSGALTIVPKSSSYPSQAAFPLTDTATGAVYDLFVSAGSLSIKVN